MKDPSKFLERGFTGKTIKDIPIDLPKCKSKCIKSGNVVSFYIIKSINDTYHVDFVFQNDIAQIDYYSLPEYVDRNSVEKAYYRGIRDKFIFLYGRYK